MESVEKRLTKVQRAAKGRDKDAVAELAVLEKLHPVLEAGKAARTIDLMNQKCLLLKDFSC